MTPREGSILVVLPGTVDEVVRKSMDLYGAPDGDGLTHRALVGQMVSRGWVLRRGIHLEISDDGSRAFARTVTEWRRICLSYRPT